MNWGDERQWRRDLIKRSNKCVWEVTGFSAALSLCVVSRWPVLLPSLAVILHLFFRHCQGLISTDQKTSRFLFQLHSLPPTSLWQIFKEHRDYLFSLCAAGRLPPRQTLTGIRSECSRFRKVLVCYDEFNGFFAGFSPTPLWAKVIGRWCPGQEGEKFFRFFKENMLIAGCSWKQVDCRGWKWPASP